MYCSLLVPLDRSSFAEQALPLAVSIARRANARLDLAEVHTLYALEDPTAACIPFDPKRDAERKRQEQLYLDATAKWVTTVSRVSASAGVLAGSAVLAATVADAILERARAGKADLIVMATHGRGLLSTSGSAAWRTNSSAGPACRSCCCRRPATMPPGSSRNLSWIAS